MNQNNMFMFKKQRQFVPLQVNLDIHTLKVKIHFLRKDVEYIYHPGSIKRQFLNIKKKL